MPPKAAQITRPSDNPHQKPCAPISGNPRAAPVDSAMERNCAAQIQRMMIITPSIMYNIVIHVSAVRSKLGSRPRIQREV